MTVLSGSAFSGACGGSASRISPGTTRDSTGSCGMRARWSATQSTRAWAAMRNSSGVMAPILAPPGAGASAAQCGRLRSNCASEIGG